MEQLPNFTQQAVYKLICSRAKACGYTVSPFEMKPKCYGLPSARTRLLVIFEFGNTDVAATYLKALQRHRRKQEATLKEWWPDREWYWIGRSHDRWTHIPLVVPAAIGQMPTLSTKTPMRKKPSKKDYLGGQHVFKRREADASPEVYDQAVAISREEMLQIQGFPSDWPISQEGIRCKCCEVCKH